MAAAKYFIEVYETMYGFTGSSVMQMPEPKCEIDMVKALKKWYNHIRKDIAYYANPDISYYAVVKFDDGSYHDLSMEWANEEMQYDPNIPFC